MAVRAPVHVAIAAYEAGGEHELTLKSGAKVMLVQVRRPVSRKASVSLPLPRFSFLLLVFRQHPFESLLFLSNRCLASLSSLFLAMRAYMPLVLLFCYRQRSLSSSRSAISCRSCLGLPVASSPSSLLFLFLISFSASVSFSVSLYVSVPVHVPAPVSCCLAFSCTASEYSDRNTYQVNGNVESEKIITWENEGSMIVLVVCCSHQPVSSSLFSLFLFSSAHFPLLFL